MDRHLRQDILGAVAGEPRDLVIDLRRVADLSSTALAALVGVQARQRSRLKSLTLVCGERSGTEMALARSGMKGDFRTVTEIPRHGDGQRQRLAGGEGHSHVRRPSSRCGTAGQLARVLAGRLSHHRRSSRVRRPEPTRPCECLRPPHQGNGDTLCRACPTGPGSPPLERSCQRGDDVNHEFRHGPPPTPRRTRRVEPRRRPAPLRDPPP